MGEGWGSGGEGSDSCPTFVYLLCEYVDVLGLTFFASKLFFFIGFIHSSYSNKSFVFVFRRCS